jgi:hypothetical protein
MSYLMDRLTRELGADARKIALERHPELTHYSPELQEKIIEAVEYVMNFHQFPRTAEFAERAYTVLQSNGELGRIAGENAPAPTPEGFKPRPPEDEELFFANWDNRRSGQISAGQISNRLG